jgi:YidC/Oxa1 family membrane protein insertase
MADNRNTILAIVLSLVVLLGWQYFVAQPQMERQRQLAEQQAAETQSQTPAPSDSAAPQTPGVAGSANVPGTGTPVAGSAAPGLSREAAVGASPRVTIDTDRVEGSINLTGGRIDDLRLKDYHETVDPTSPTIVLFSPRGSPKPYYADFGLTADPGAGIALPDQTSEWSAPAGATLTPTTPVTLTWDNGAGLVFTRTISIDDNYMFTVEQGVRNETDAAVQLYPYGLIARNGLPDTTGFYILHEGLIGVFGEEGLREIDYDTLQEDGPVRPAKVNDGWLGITDKYWAATLIPTPGSAFQPQLQLFRADGQFPGGFPGRRSGLRRAGASVQLVPLRRRQGNQSARRYEERSASRTSSC